MSITGSDDRLDHIYSSINSDINKTSKPVRNTVSDNQPKSDLKSHGHKPPMKKVTPKYLNGSLSNENCQKCPSDKNSNYKAAHNSVNLRPLKHDREVRSVSPKGNKPVLKPPIRVTSLECLRAGNKCAVLEKGPVKKHSAWDHNCDLHLHFHCKNNVYKCDDDCTDVNEKLLNGVNRDKNIKDNIIEDNFMTDEEIRAEVESARLY